MIVVRVRLNTFYHCVRLLSLHKSMANKNGVPIFFRLRNDDDDDSAFYGTKIFACFTILGSHTQLYVILGCRNDYALPTGNGGHGRKIRPTASTAWFDRAPGMDHFLCITQ